MLFEWDTFFAASLAAVGDRDLAYANAIEALNGETRQALCPTMRARVDGRALIARNRLWVQSLYLGSTKNSMIAGSWRKLSRHCCAGIAGGRNTAKGMAT